MKKTTFLLMLVAIVPFLCFGSCKQKGANVERVMENGVEVVLNHLEPYKIKGEPTSLQLEKEFTIDLEREDIAGLGLLDIWAFDVDSEGNIYILDIRSKKDWIYKFDSNGKFLSTLVRAGQGPDEMETPFDLKINNHDEIVAGDSGKRKYLIFTKAGNLIREISMPANFGDAVPLDNGKYLIWWQEAYSLMDEYFYNRLVICDRAFKEIKEIYSRKKANDYTAKRVRGTRYAFDYGASAKNIYLADEERGYEISVLDLDGNSVRKIRKEFNPVKVSEEFKKQHMKPFENPESAVQAAIGKKTYFPRYMPPFYRLMPDDEGRLLVMTYEQGENPGEYVYDIFNQDGVFVGRKSLRLSWQTPNFLSKIKKDRLYGIWEKENGYKELVVYRMRWE